METRFYLLLFCLAITNSLTSQNETEPNNNCNEANLFDIPAQIFGKINPEGDCDFYEIIISEPGVIEARVFTTAGSSELSFDIAIRDGNCDQIKIEGFSDDKSIKKRVCEPGSYFIEVKDHFGRSSDSLYTLQIGFDNRDTFECNDNFFEAAELEFGSQIIGTIKDEGDCDYFKLEVITPGIIEGRVFTTAGSSELSFDLTLFNDSFEEIKIEGFSDDISVKKRVCETGTYYIKVNDHFNRCSDAIYILQVDFDDRDPYECNDDFFSATPLDLGTEITATLRDEGDCDYFEFELLEPGTIEVRVFTTAGSSELSFDILLYNSAFEMIDAVGWSDDISLESQILEPGIYYIKIQDHFERCSDATYVMQPSFIPTTSTVELYNPLISVTPNPSTGFITLEFQGGSNIPAKLNLSLYNSNGQFIKSLKLEPSETINTISIHDLSPGVYYIQLKEGTRQMWKKFMKL